MPKDITITGDPAGDGAVGQDPRSITVPVRVAGPFGLRADGATTAAVPACASVDVPFTLMRDRAFGGTVTLAAENLPQGVSAQILPGTTIAPGGNFYVTGTLRLTGSAVIPPTRGRDAARDVAGRGRPDAGDPRERRGGPSGTLDQTVGLTPRALKPGTTIHVSGPGFCPGTTVRSGPLPVPATADADGRGLTFTVPRFAMPGAVTITPPAGGFPAYTTTNALDVRTFRGTYGFPFKNYDYGTLGIDELTDEFGADDLFITINPCWPFGSCRINTGVLDPVAAVVWGVLNIALHSTHGHCFGMSRAVQELIARKTPYARFSGTATVPFELPSATGPSSGLSDWLDAKHAAQGSSEFLNAWAGRDSKVAAQVAWARTELAAGRFPIITLAHGGMTDGEGHACWCTTCSPRPTAGPTCTSMTTTGRRRPAELGDASPTERRGGQRHPHDRARLVVNLGSETWSGGDDGKLFIAPFSTIPDNPSLPGLTDLATIPALLIFGSNGAARTTDATDGAQLLPALDDSAAPGTTASWRSRRARAAPRAGGRSRTGPTAEVVTGRGTAAGVAGVDTAKGVKDTVRADVTGTPSVAFDSGAARALDLTVRHGRHRRRRSARSAAAAGASARR